MITKKLFKKLHKLDKKLEEQVDRYYNELLELIIFVNSMIESPHPSIDMKYDILYNLMRIRE